MVNSILRNLNILADKLDQDNKIDALPDYRNPNYSIERALDRIADSLEGNKSSPSRLDGEYSIERSVQRIVNNFPDGSSTSGGDYVAYTKKFSSIPDVIFTDKEYEILSDNTPCEFECTIIMNGIVRENMKFGTLFNPYDACCFCLQNLLLFYYGSFVPKGANNKGLVMNVYKAKLVTIDTIEAETVAPENFFSMYMPITFTFYITIEQAQALGVL